LFLLGLRKCPYLLAHGTADPLADVATQARFARDLASILEPVPESATAGDCGPVYGELLIFDDPETRLPAIDRLEGFHPWRFLPLSPFAGSGVGHWSRFSRLALCGGRFDHDPVHPYQATQLAMTSLRSDSFAKTRKNQLTNWRTFI